MAALPFSFLILGTSVLAAGNSPQWVRVLGPRDSLVYPAATFAWDSAATRLLIPVVDSGYAFAGIRVTNSFLRGDTLVLETSVDSGSIVTVEGLLFSGKFRTNPSLLVHLVRFQPFLYSSFRVKELIKLLVDEGCEVQDWELLGEDSTAELHFLIEERSVPNRFNAGMGYSEDEGIIGSADLSLYNLLGGRRKISLSWFQLSRYNLSFVFSGRDPYPFHLPFGLDATASFRSFNENSYHLGVSAGVFVAVRLFETGIGYGYEQDRADTEIVTKNLAITRMSTDFLKVDLEAGQRRAEHDQAYLRASAQAQATIPFIWGFSLAVSPSGALVASPDSLLSTELIPLGGALSIRGYGEEEYRGKIAVWSRQELRWGTKNFYLYPLFDIGWLDLEGLLLGYGAGIEVATPLGRLELDAALPLGGEWRESKLHLSLGAEF